MGRVGPLHHPTYLSRIKKEWGTRVSLVPMEWQRRRLRGGRAAMAAIEARRSAKCGCHDRRRSLGTASGARARAVEQCVECGNDRRMAPRLRTDARLRVVEARARGCGIGPSDVAAWYGQVVGCRRTLVFGHWCGAAPTRVSMVAAGRWCRMVAAHRAAAVWCGATAHGRC